MKLVDILARELEGWPEGASHAVCPGLNFGGKPYTSFTQNGAPAPDKFDLAHTWTICGEAIKSPCQWISFKLPLSQEPEDRKTAIVTRSQWQAAVEALRNEQPRLKVNADSSILTDGLNSSPSIHIQQFGRCTRQQPDIDWSKAGRHVIGAFVPEKELPGMRREMFFVVNKKEEHVHQAGFSGIKDTGADYHVFSEFWKWVPREEVLTWNGEGLPPVGVNCEYSIGGHSWFPCEIRHVLDNDPDPDADGWTAVIWCPHLEKEQVSRVAPVGHFKFRPIRTPEQIAAEEREKAVREMLKLMPNEDPDRSYCELLCEALYDAGYRKQVQP